MDYLGDLDIREHLGQGSDAFRKAMIPVYIDQHPDMSRVTAGRAMGDLHAASETLQIGDLVLSPTGGPNIWYHYGIVASDYEFHSGKVQPHRRGVD